MFLSLQLKFKQMTFVHLLYKFDGVAYIARDNQR